MGKYNWEPFTEELAQKILSYSNNREALLNKVRQIYTQYNASQNPKYIKTDPTKIYPFCGWTDTSRRDILLNDIRLHAIDPFSVFAYIYNGTRVGVINAVDLAGDIFDLDHRFPISEYDGNRIPTTTSACKTVVYYSVHDDYFSHSKSGSPQNYRDAMDFAWSFFENALLYDPSLEEDGPYFDIVADQFEKMYGLFYVDIVTTTINLFYIAPTKYLSLDLNTINYIKANSKKYPKTAAALSKYDLNKGAKNPLPGKEYLKLCLTLQEELDSANEPDIKTFSDLTYKAASMSDTIDISSINKNNAKFLGNIIYYGIPGSGKSYRIKADIIDKLDQENDGDGSVYYERILFHPDYSYSDFVGQILPIKDNEGNVTYNFVPGPFTRILGRALEPENQNHNFYLIIDEINRGNAPAIFGDIFQLLDRVENGKPHAGESQYHINNKDIQDELGISEIYLPKNLSIVATMNTSDQNVFTLDTAFKRRWRMEYIKDDIDDAKEYKNLIIGKTGVTWMNFHDALNAAISGGTSHIVSIEDKRLGAYFCTKEEITDITLFTNKVLRYLWDDVARINKNIFRTDTVKTFEDIYDAKDEDNFFEIIFQDAIFKKLK